MITTNVLHRVFLLIFQTNMGTMFTIEVDEKQYLITAKHLVQKIKKEDSLKTFHQNKIKKVKVFLVGHCGGENDISVLSTNIQLSPNYPMKPSAGNLVYGQDVYFLGFPYLDGKKLSKMNRGFPFPFVKKAIISNMSDIGKISVFYLDGHNNPGFSGGPVIFKPVGKTDYQVAGVISGYKFRNDPVIHRINGVESNTNLIYQSNTGIIMSYNIKCAVDLIKKNPIGYKVKKSKM